MAWVALLALGVFLGNNVLATPLTLVPPTLPIPSLIMLYPSSRRPSLLSLFKFFKRLAVCIAVRRKDPGPDSPPPSISLKALLLPPSPNNPPKTPHTPNTLVVPPPANDKGLGVLS